MAVSQTPPSWRIARGLEVSGQQVSEATMWSGRMQPGLGWTHKKSVAASERDESARRDYRATGRQPQAVERFVSPDESGTQTTPHASGYGSQLHDFSGPKPPLNGGKEHRPSLPLLILIYL
jgi:hypothetical protein